MTVQHRARLADRQVDHDDRAARTGIGDEGGLAAGMEAHVVEIAALQRHVLAEPDDLRYLVGGEIDAHQLRAAGDHLLVGGRRRIEHPEIAMAVGHDRLHTNEMIARLHLGRLGIAPGIPAIVGIGLQRTVLSDLGHRDGRVLGPAREIDEYAAVGSRRHAGHLMREARDLL